MADEWGQFESAEDVGQWSEFEPAEPAQQQVPEEQIQPTAVEAGLDQIYAGQEQIMPGMSMWPRFAEGTVRGLQKAGIGAEQALESVPSIQDIWSDDEERQAKQIKLKSDLARLDTRTMNLGAAGEMGGMVGESAPSMLLPGGPTGSLGKKIVGGVVADTAASLADPVREEETRVGNIGRAATFSAGVRGTGGMLSAGFRRLANARSGNMRSEDIQTLIDAADAEDIRLFFQDVSDSASARMAAQAAETIFGSGNRKTQNKEAYEAASRWLANMSGDGDDYAELVQTGLQRKLDIFKKKASQMYGRVREAIGDAGEVTTPSFNSQVDDALATEMAKGTRANPRVVDFLEKYRDAPRGNFDEMIEFRSDMRKGIDDLVGSSKTTGNSISYSSEVALRNAYNAIDDDMEAFARSNGAADLWRAANDFYRENVADFKKGKLRALLKADSAGNFDEQSAWRYLTQPSTNPKRAQLMWQSLDSRGRQAVRLGLVSEAIDAATPTSGPFSPAKFATYMEKRMPVADQFFRGERGRELKGLVNVMRHVEKSGQFLENPPTGYRAVPYLLGAGTVASPVAAAAGGTTLGSVKLMFETKAGRDLLLAANTATPGSQEFDKIIQGIETFLARASN